MIEKYINECLSCPNPLCEKGCPLKNHIRDFILALKHEDLKMAISILDMQNPFPEITCRVCAYEKQCEGHCVKSFKGNPVIVHEIEKYISDNSNIKREVKSKNGHSVALIGAGIANLALAKLLALGGYEVQVFEKQAFIGGAVNSGIPPFRLDKSYLDKIYQELLAYGVKFVFDSAIDSLDKLMQIKKDFDRVVIGTGCQKENIMSIPGIELAFKGLEVLYDFNIKANFDKYRDCNSAIVVGGGNVAIDVARSLKQCIKNVTIVYRRSEKEMPANLVEIKEAKQEGINFEFLVNPKAISKDNDGSLLVDFDQMELGEVDESGRASFRIVNGCELKKSCDMIVMAIGQKHNKIDEGITYDGHHTSLENVYVVGDAKLGPSTVAHCINDAKTVKELIDSSF